MSDAAEGVRTALRVVVRDHGRRVAEDPVRVRALLLDALAASAWTSRPEVDAVVVAAEEGVPALLDGSRLAADAAQRRLQERGLSTVMAAFAVATWETVLVTDPGASTAGASSTPTVPGRPGPRPNDRPGPRPNDRPGPRPADRAAMVAPTEIPLPAGQRAAFSPGSPSGAAAPGAVGGTGATSAAAGSAASSHGGAGTGTNGTYPVAGEPSGSRWPPVLTVSRGTTVVAGVASLAVAFGLGFFGSGALGGGDRTAELASSPVATPATVTNTAVVRVTTVQTKPVTKSVTKAVTRTVTVDSSKLKATSDRFTTQPYLVWAGNRTCALKAPAKATKIRACYGIYRVRATGTQKSWKVLSATVTGRGKVSPAGKDINYTYVVNGPSTTTISFVIGAGSYRSKGTLRIQLDCNRSLGCGKALP